MTGLPTGRIGLIIAFTGYCFALLLLMSPATEAKPEQLTAKIVVVGDSLSAGYGLAPGLGFPEQLEAQLRRDGHNVTVINAGVSGDTSSGGLARLAWSVPDDADAVILELGANDALRGVATKETLNNLDTILARLKGKNIQVLLAGMEAPRNLGADYVNRFHAIYQALAKKYDPVFYPFFLDGVALNPKLNLADGLHPNKAGVATIVKNIRPYVTQLLGRIAAQKSASK